MASLIIHQLPDEDEDAQADVVAHIADMIRGGYTSGYHPYWTLDA